MTSGSALMAAEARLRARGLTGGQAFDALLPALAHRLAGAPLPEDPDVAAIASTLPADVDLLGLAYERFFPDLWKGLRGQFFTPPSIARLLVTRLAVRRSDRVLDPTAGAGGLLRLAGRHTPSVAGLEIDPRLVALANLSLASVGLKPTVRGADFFRTEPVPVDVVVANPPFSVPIDDPVVLDRFPSFRGQRRVLSDHLFLHAVEDWVVPGGRAGLVVPFALLVNPSWAALRERVDAAWHRIAACALPEGVFRPFGGAAGRAALLWLERRGAARSAADPLWATLSDPGYDPSSREIRPTSDDEVDARIAGIGFVALAEGAWTPTQEAPRAGQRAVSSVARLRRGAPPPGPASVIDLADADRNTGECAPRIQPDSVARTAIATGDVLVARLRPNLGNVAVAPPSDLPLAGSPEWVVLEPHHGRHWLLHALRTPAWRNALPVTHGQTRPRITAEAVLASAVPWPNDALTQRVDALSARWFAERQVLRDRLDRLQQLVDAYAEGSLDDASLAEALDDLSPRSSS